MDHRTHPSQADEALRQTRENPIVSQPATVEACQKDYADAADVRATMDEQDARGRR